MEKTSYFVLIPLLFCAYLFPRQVASQNIYVVKILQPETVQAPIISEVTVTPENKNLIKWEVQDNDRIQGFNIYRDDISPPGIWELVGKMNYPDNFSFIDPSCFPQLRAYRYRISAVDVCENELFSTTVHKTIKLSIKETSTDCFSLNWNAYKGFSVMGYNIYCGENLESMMLIESLSDTDTTFTDCGNSAADIYYMVEAIGTHEQMHTEKKLSIQNNITRSNIVFGRTILSSSDSLDDSELSVYPNPMCTNALVEFPYDPTQEYRLSIIDLEGHIVLSNPVSSGVIEIKRGNLKEGVYILQITGRRTFKKKLMVGSNKV